MPADFVIHNRWALGDTVVLSAMVRDVALNYPGQYRLAVIGHYSSYWKNNPHVVPFDKQKNAPVLRFDCVSGIKAAGRGIKMHYVSWFHKEFERLTGIHVPCLRPKGDYHLSAQERKPIIKGRYWVVIGGGKLDMTAKWWYYDRYQEAVDRLTEKGIHFVQAGAHFNRHVQPVLHNCIDATTLTEEMRDLIALIAHSDGVLCGITGPMHIAAMFDKPCVVVAGGREEPWWEEYSNAWNAFGPKCEPVKVPHRFLHTVGMLDCGIGNLNKGCWRSRTVPIEASDLNTKEGRDKLCTQPVRTGPQPVPKCMDMIQVDQVVEAVMSYYEEGFLPPIGNLPQKRHLLEATTVLVNQQTMKELAAWGELGPPPELLVPGVKPKKSVPPPEFKPRAGEDPAFAIMDNPTIGGRYTVFVLGYGDHATIFKRCLEGIVNTLPAARRDIRVALNQPSQGMLDVVQSFDEGTITKVYTSLGDPKDGNARKKYEAMREMFWDEACPITSKYLLWFDDDTMPVNKLWAIRLTETILANHRHNVRAYGRKLFHDLKMYQREGHSPLQWFQAAPWWKNQHLRLKGVERTAPNGSCIDFMVGWFWAMEVAAMRAANIPDPRLHHNGGDITIGAQLHQAGYKIKSFNQERELIFTPPKDKGGRRGWSEAFPWADPETRANHVVGS